MSKSKLVLIDSLTPEQIASVCEHTFLNRSEAYRQSAGKGESPANVIELLRAVSGGNDGYIEINPSRVRIGESSLWAKL